MKNYNLNNAFVLYFLINCLTFLSIQDNFAQSHLENMIPSTCQGMESINLEGWGLFTRQQLSGQNEFLSDSPTPAYVSYQLGYSTLLSVGGEDENYIRPADYAELLANTGVDDANLSGGAGSRFIRIGGNLNTTSNSSHSEEIVRKYVITPQNSSLNFNAFAVFNNSPNVGSSPGYFKYKISVKYNDGTFLNLPTDISYVFINSSSSGVYVYNDKKIKEIYSSINFNDYAVNYCKNPIMTISYMVSDGEPNNNNNAYAYIYQSCDTNLAIETITDYSGNVCIDVPTTFVLNDNLQSILNSNETFNWTIKDSNNTILHTSNDIDLIYNFSDPGTYTISLNIGLCSEFNFVLNEYFVDCLNLPSFLPRGCPDCTSFSLIKNQKYVISGWTKLMNQVGLDNYESLDPVPKYENVYLGISFFDITAALIEDEIKFEPSGEIIDGWQKIQGEILIPNDVYDIKISLINDNPEELSAFFDDIRVHPFNGNLKSFVYDQASQKLMAELDENNYATFYEYDKEGGLVRVKKETEKGIYTIQETRSSTRKN